MKYFEKLKVILKLNNIQLMGIISFITGLIIFILIY